MKKNLIRNRWSAQQEAEEAERKKQKQRLAQKNAPHRYAQMQHQDEKSKDRPTLFPDDPSGYADDAGERPKTNRKAFFKNARVRKTPTSASDNQSGKAKGVFSRPKMNKESGRKNSERRADVMLFQITMILLAVGLIMVFSSSSYEGIVNTESGNGLAFFTKQFLFAIVGFFALMFMLTVPQALIKKISLPCLILFMGLVCMAMAFGADIYGAKRWIQVGGGFSFMPSDFVKPFSVVVFGQWLAKKRDRLNELSEYGMAFVYMAVISGIIAIEDLGTAIVFFCGLFAMLLVAGAPYRFIVPTIGLGLGAFAVAVAMAPYRLARLTGFLHPFALNVDDPNSAQLRQSLYAFGDGGLFGVGLGNGAQKMSHLFGSHTDFIYSIIGEELGLVGALCVLALFVAFIWRGYWLALHIPNFLESITLFGLTSFIGLQALINMGVASGVLPVTGITLPFISYGGTSLVVSLAMVGYMMNLSRGATRH